MHTNTKTKHIACRLPCGPRGTSASVNRPSFVPVHYGRSWNIGLKRLQPALELILTKSHTHAREKKKKKRVFKMRVKKSLGICRDDSVMGERADPIYGLAYNSWLDDAAFFEDQSIITAKFSHLEMVTHLWTPNQMSTKHWEAKVKALLMPSGEKPQLDLPNFRRRVLSAESPYPYCRNSDMHVTSHNGRYV